MSLAAIVLNLGYVAFVGSAYTRTLAWLRVTLIIGSGCLIIFGTIEKIWPMVGWNVLIVGSHFARIIGERRVQAAVKLTTPEAAHRDKLFPGVSDFDFNMLWSMGQTALFYDEVIVADGSHPSTVSVLIHGKVTIEKDGAVMRELPANSLIGEMSFVSGEPATVDVVAHDRVVVRQWDQRQLATLDQAHPPSAKVFRDLISRDLASKAQAAY